MWSFQVIFYLSVNVFNKLKIVEFVRSTAPLVWVWYGVHCMKIVQILRFFWSVIPVFGLNTETYGVNLRIQSKYRKIRTKKSSVFGHF